MDIQKLHALIGKMIYPSVTINSLTMFANKLDQTYGQVGLLEFLAALCRMDIYKAVMMTKQLTGVRRSVAEKYVYQVLAERCKSADEFSHLELLAITACKDAALMQTASAFLTKEIVNKAMQSADGVVACNLLQLGITVLPQESCVWIQKSFCQQISTEYSERTEEALRELLPDLLRYAATDVLSALVEIIGVERIAGFYGKELPEELNHLILSGKDSVGVWELFFYFFFRQSHTQEEILEKGLWYVQIWASEAVYEQVRTSFFLHVATHYGVEHPVLEYIEKFEPSNEDFQRYIERYRDAFRRLWANPRELSRFLKKTAPCNPYLKARVQEKRYQLLQTAQDHNGYELLKSLFEAQLPAGDILTIFFSTDLKKRLPLEDMFYLAQHYEMLSDFLEELQDKPFTGMVSFQSANGLTIYPYSYFSTELHIVRFTYTVMENTGYEQQLKHRELQYTITAFDRGHIRVRVYGDNQRQEVKRETTITWETAIEQLRLKKDLKQLSQQVLQQFAITEFTLDDVMEHDITLFTGLLMERADCLEGFLKLLHLCKWNVPFLGPEMPLPIDFFSSAKRYQREAEELFRFLLETQENMQLVLQLYFSSIYKAIVPLSRLLIFAPRDRLMEYLPDFQIYCRILEEGSILCRPANIVCAPVCSMASTEGISHTEYFAAVIVDFIVVDQYVSRILLQPYQMGAADIEERGELFGYIAHNIHISKHKAQRLATLPSAADCKSRELKLNLRCMKEAVLLRRSNAVELKRLIQTMGTANPFAFGVSLAAERIYLQKKKKDAQDDAVSMVLNAKDIEDIRDFYLHTHIKFHLQLPQFFALIRERRGDLEDQFLKLFEGVTFCAIADNHGNIWMPWVAQNTLQVSQEYAGKVLLCEICIKLDNTIDIEVKALDQSEKFFEVLENCLLSGYQMVQSMNHLVAQLQRAEAAEKTLQEKETVSSSEYFRKMSNMAHSEQFSHEEFAQAIQKMIRDYCELSSTKMKNKLIELTRKWLHLHPDKEQIPMLLQEICRCFEQQYQGAHLNSDMSQLLYEYVGMWSARAFELQMLECDLPPKEAGVDIPEKRSFVQEYHYLQRILTGTTFASLHLLKDLPELIDAYCQEVSQEEMETAVLKLTAQWMQIYAINDGKIMDLLNLHQAFIRSYQSGTLGVALCQQAYQFMPEDSAERLERGICKITYQCFADHPELKQMLPPVEQWTAQLQRWLWDSRYPAVDAAKRILRLLRYYNRVVSAAEMEKLVLSLVQELTKACPDYPHMGQMVKALHTTYEDSYGFSNIGRFLWQQACRQLDSDIARASQASEPLPVQTFAARIKKIIRNFNAYASAPEMCQEILILTEQLLQQTSDENKLRDQLYVIHNNYINYYRSDCLAGLLCRLIEKYQGEDVARAFEKQLEESLRILQG